MNRKPICRLYFNGSQKALGLFDNDQRKETKIAIRDVDKIYEHADKLRSTVERYETK